MLLNNTQWVFTGNLTWGGGAFLKPLDVNWMFICLNINSSSISDFLTSTFISCPTFNFPDRPWTINIEGKTTQQPVLYKLYLQPHFQESQCWKHVFIQSIRQVPTFIFSLTLCTSCLYTSNRKLGQWEALCYLSMKRKVKTLHFNTEQSEFPGVTAILIQYICKWRRFSSYIFFFFL